MVRAQADPSSVAVLSSSVPSPEKKNPAPSASEPVSIRQENPLLTDHWDGLVSQLLETSIFHRAAWAKVLVETYGFTPVYLSGFCGNTFASALPMLEVDSWLTGKRGVSLPFTDECEALNSSGHSSAPLIQEALQIGRARKWRYLELRGGKNLFNAAPPSVNFHGHKLSLADDPDALFSRFESSVRRALRKAKQSGLRVEFSQTLGATSEYYALHCQTRKEHGLPPQPFNFFRQIHEHILAKNLGVVVTATFEERPVASAIFFHQGPSAVYKFGASLKSASDLRANNLVMWEAIKWLAAKGVKELRFGRTSIHNEGLRRYKLGWGTEEYAIHYYRYDFCTSTVVSAKDESTGWHNKLFRALPLPLAKCAGKVLYKHVA